ncbi:TonB family C-terminal domain protein [Verrucomicrobiia bacterium DG1235]|nr:TonB family C-terminal domain protein [Verrucomicrobiae bacterium DG1235]
MSERAWKVFIGTRTTVFLFCSGLFVAVALSQTQVLVSYEDEMLPVVSMDGSAPVVQIGGERISVTEGSVRVVEANRFTDGAVEVVRRDAVMGQDYGSPFGGFFFRFEAMVQAERDFEDCYILFVISPESGEVSYVMREIPDINTRGMERIAVTLPVNPGFGGGTFGYKLFSRGEEIRRYEPDEPIELREVGSGSESDRPRSSSSNRSANRSSGQGEPARILKARLLDFPEELIGKASGGYASAVFSIGVDGRVLELLDLQADFEAFAPEVWKTVVETRYEPGRFNGEALVTTVRQTFFFNEFAPFSEEMVMLPYPSLDDRDASAIFAPLPKLKLAKSAKARIEVVVDVLGRVKESRVLKGLDSGAGEAVLEEVERWIFLPAIVNGFPAEQRLEIPISFGLSG